MTKKTIRKKKVETKTDKTRSIYRSIKSVLVSIFDGKVIIPFILGTVIGYGGCPVSISVFPARTHKEEKREKREIIVVENLVSFVKTESKILTQEERTKLIGCYNKVLGEDYSEGYEIREALRDEVGKIVSDNIVTFSDKLSDKLSSMEIQDDVSSARKVFKEIIEGLNSVDFNDFLDEKQEFEHKIIEQEALIERYKKELETKTCPPQQIQYRRR